MSLRINVILLLFYQKELLNEIIIKWKTVIKQKELICVRIESSQ